MASLGVFHDLQLNRITWDGGNVRFQLLQTIAVASSISLSRIMRSLRVVAGMRGDVGFEADSRRYRSTILALPEAPRRRHAPDLFHVFSGAQILINATYLRKCVLNLIRIRV